MKRNYFILCLLLISSIVFAQKEERATKQDARELMPSLTIKFDKKGGDYESSPLQKDRKAIPPVGESVFLSEDFQNLTEPSYFPEGWDQYDFDEAYVFGVFDATYLYYSNWMSLTLNSDPDNAFMASFSYLTEDAFWGIRFPYDGSADDWMVTPALNLPTTTQDIALFFKTTSLNETDLDGLQIYVIEETKYAAMASKTPEDLIDASDLVYESEGEPSVWTQRGLLLNAYKGKNVRVMFRNNSLDKFALGLDDIYVSLEEPIDPEDMTKVRNLTLEQDGFHVDLSWELDIDFTFSDFGWANSTQTVVSAMHGGAENIHVSRFAPSDLTEYDGKLLGGLKFGILNNAAANTTPANVSYTVQVYQGGSLGDPGTLVMEQAVTSWEMGWNELMFDQPVAIDASKELWFGFKMVKKTAINSFPTNTVRTNTAGSDIPYVANKSDVIYVEVDEGVWEWTTWTDMTAGGENANSPVWAFAGMVIDEGSGAPSYISHIKTIPEKTVTVDKNKNIKSFKKGLAVNKEILQSVQAIDPDQPMYSTGSKAIVFPKGYNVYRDGKLIARTSSTSYTDEYVVTGGTYKYCVTARYGMLGAESEETCKSIKFEEITSATELSTSFEGFEYNTPADGWDILGSGGAWEFSDTWDELYGLFDMPYPYEDATFAWFDGALWTEGSLSYLISPYIKPTTDKSVLRFELSNVLIDELILSLFGDLPDPSVGSDFIVMVSADQGRNWTPHYDITEDFPGYPYVAMNTIVNVDLSEYVDTPIFIAFGVQCNRSGNIVAMDNIELVAKVTGPCTPVTGLNAVQGVEPTMNTVTVTWDVKSNSIYEVGFEEGIPTGWSVLDADGDAFNWTLYAGTTPSITTHGGTHAMYSQSWDANAGALTPDNWLISDKIAIATDNTLEFWVAAQDAEYPEEHYGVYISTTDKEIASFTKVMEETLSAAPNTKAATGLSKSGKDSGSWYRKTVDLSAYAGKEVYIAFRHFDVSDQFYIVLDDVAILAKGELPTYNLYRNGVLIAEELTEAVYVDEELSTTGKYVYSITQTYKEDATCTSDPAYFTLDFTSVCDLYPVTDLVATQDDKYISLEWNNPGKAFYTEGFENGGLIPTGWTQENVAGSMPWQFVKSHSSSKPGAAASGEYFAVFPDRAGGNAKTKLISPKLDLAKYADNPVTLGFNIYAASWFGDHTDLKVYYKNTAAGEWIELAFITEAYEAWEEVKVVLPNLTNSYWIAFEGQSVYGYGLGIDDVKLYGPYDLPKKIYRNGEVIASGVMGSSFVDKLRVSDVYEYCVTMPIENCETPMVSVTVDALVGEINTTFPDNVLPYQWVNRMGDDARWEFADTYVATEVPFTDDTFVWLNTAYWDNNDWSYLITPVFEPIEEEYMLAFDLAAVRTVFEDNIGKGAKLFVDISTDFGETWTMGEEDFLGAIPGSNLASNNTDLASIDLTAYLNQDIMARFRAISDHGSFITAIDNIRLTNKASLYDCDIEPATNLEATVVSNDIVLVWDAPGKTAKEAKANVLLNEGFEGNADGWSVIDADGDGYKWGLLKRSNFKEPDDIVIYEGDGFAVSASFDNESGAALTPDNWLISPAVELTVDTYLTYAVAAMDGDWASETYGVYISTTDKEVASFTELFKETMTAAPGNKRTVKGSFGKSGLAKAQGTWKERSIDLSEYTGETVYIAFRHYNSTDMFQLILDAVKISDSTEDVFGENDAPMTYAVMRNGRIIADGLTQASYKDAGRAKIDGEHVYGIIVEKGLCTAASDEVATVLVGPDCDKNKVTSFVAEVNANIVSLNWTAENAEVTKAFDVYENGQLIAQGITATSLDIIPAVTGDIDYCVVAIGDNCESDPACGQVYYMPNAMPVVNGNIAVYPTLTTGVVKVETAAKAMVSVTDISGRVLETTSSNGKLELDLNYSNGVYLIVVDTEGATFTHKVILKK